MGRRKESDHTLCWDCEWAVDPEVCPWVAEGKAVPGWWAVSRDIRVNGEFSESFLVFKCPLFRRDAEQAGLKEYKPEEKGG